MSEGLPRDFRPLLPEHRRLVRDSLVVVAYPKHSKPIRVRKLDGRSVSLSTDSSSRSTYSNNEIKRTLEAERHSLVAIV